MAFWEVHAPLGGLFPRSCLKGAGVAGWLGGIGWDGMGAWGLEMRQPATADGDGGGGGGPVGAGTPAARSIPYPPWSREGRSFFRETPEGGDERRVASQTNTGREGGRARGRQGPGIRVDCT